MKNTTFLLFFLISVLSLTAQEYSKTSIIVKFKSNELKDDVKVSEVLQKHPYIKTVNLNGTKEDNTNIREILSFKFEENTNILDVIEDLKNTQLFEYVETDYIAKGAGKRIVTSFSTVPNETLFNRQWGLKNDGTFSFSSGNVTAGADISMEFAWDITTGNSNITIAVLDTGLRMTHPEIASRIWVNPGESLDSSDSDSNGYDDDLNGWDFVNNDNDPTDDHGHGTNVTGIATATGNNNIGYAGIDWKCKIMPIKVLDNQNSGFYSWMISGIYYAVDNGAKVINMSIGGSSFSQSLKDAVDYARDQNVTMLISMMNFDNNVPYYPAAYESTIAVGSTDPDDTRSSPFPWSSTSGSNYGSHIDVVAPGNYMFGLTYDSDTNYEFYWAGTSQATPVVAGLVSLILDISPNKTVEEIRTLLRDTADDEVGDSEDTPGWDQYFGAGRVNASTLLNRVLSTESFDIAKFNIYPNPSNSVINLPLELNNKKFSIFSIIGKEVMKGTIENGIININFINNGTYLLKIDHKDIQVIRKIIKI